MSDLTADDMVDVSMILVRDHFDSVIRMLELSGCSEDEWTDRLRLCRESVAWELRENANLPRGAPRAPAVALRLVPDVSA